jgi:hypothetical protein
MKNKTVHNETIALSPENLKALLSTSEAMSVSPEQILNTIVKERLTKNTMNQSLTDGRVE